MDDYGFHHGDVWYRGRYQAGESADRVTLHYGGGGAGMIQVWLDGRFLGQHELPTNLTFPVTTGTAEFAIPADLRGGGEHVLAVMVRNNGNNWDLNADDARRMTAQPREGGSSSASRKTSSVAGSSAMRSTWLPVTSGIPRP